MVSLIKPQFGELKGESEDLARSGVVRDSTVTEQILESVTATIAEPRFGAAGTHGVLASGLLAISSSSAGGHSGVSRVS